MTRIVTIPNILYFVKFPYVNLFERTKFCLAQILEANFFSWPLDWKVYSHCISDFRFSGWNSFVNSDNGIFTNSKKNFAQKLTATATGRGGDSPQNFLTAFFFFFQDKSCNLFKFVSVLLSASVERVGVSRMRDFFIIWIILLIFWYCDYYDCWKVKRPSWEINNHYELLSMAYGS